MLFQLACGSRVFTSVSGRVALISLLSHATMSAGVFGARQYQPNHSPRNPQTRPRSARPVASQRVAAVTANGRGVTVRTYSIDP
jgi:hypothetical protein